jgi:hypothetical protein
MGNVRSRSLIFAAVVALAHFGNAAPAAASPPLPRHSASLAVAIAPAPVFAASISWHGFMGYWKGFVHRSDRVVLVVGLVGVAALFIITRGRWMK